MLKEQNINSHDKTCAMQRMDQSKKKRIHWTFKNLPLLQSQEVE